MTTDKRLTDTIKGINSGVFHSLRKKENLSYSSLGSMVGVSGRTICQIEQGLYIPSITLALKIADALHTAVTTLFEY